MKLTHLCFADDLLIFTDGSLTSVNSILTILHQFQLVSGLAINIQKTSFFSSGLNEGEVEAISLSTGIKHEILPVRYLGLPLLSKKLTLQHCSPLILQVKNRISSWCAKSLSYAGRVQLINSVISGITNYWTSSLMLPKACINAITSLCSAFLWKGNLEGRYTARVSWSSITCSKEEGGLGIRDLSAWNKACYLKLVWMIFFRSESLWVAWFRKEVLHSRLRNYWTIPTKQSLSWTSNKLIKLRNTIFPWLSVKIGNGKDTLFWFSNWSPHGNLKAFLKNDDAISSGIPYDSKISDLYHRGNWTLPPARSNEMVLVQSHISTLQLSNTMDSYTWSVEGTPSNSFSTSTIYNLLKQHNPNVPWAKEVWFSGSIPRHSFLTWLFVLNRCPTKDRLLSWGLQVDGSCLLCSSAPENRDHMFFNCDYSGEIWNQLRRKFAIGPDRSWDEILSDMQLLPPSKSTKILAGIAWQCSIYYIWAERNNRLHNHISRPPEVTLRQICRMVKNRCSSLREKRPKLSSALLKKWFTSPTPQPP